MNLGNYAANALIDFKFNSQSQTGASITLATDGVLRIYKDNSLTQRTSASGMTFTEDWDGITGVHHLRIDLSDDTDVGFFSSGSDYDIVVVGAVVDGQTVNTTLAHFSIERAGGTAGAAIRRNVALANFTVEMTTTAGAPATGLAIVTAERRLDSGAFVACANAVTEVGGGTYTIDLAAADLNGAIVTLRFTATGARQKTLTIKTVA